MRGIPNRPFHRTMSFRDALQSILLDPGLSFASLLDEETIRKVFSRHHALFGGVFQTAIVLWAFLSQCLRDGKEASCQSAVARISAFLTQSGRRIPSPNTGNFCRSRGKLCPLAIQALSQQVAMHAEAKADSRWKWCGRRVFLVDGLTFRMTDTPANQQAYPQHTTQKEGVGDPIARVVALICLATGVVLDAVIGPHKGKQTGELALFRQLIDQLQEGDVVVADRQYCSYWLIWLLMNKCGNRWVAPIGKVGGTDWSASPIAAIHGLPIGGWHRLEKWVAPIGVLVDDYKSVDGTNWRLIGGWHHLE